MIAALDADRGILGNLLPRLVDLAVADEGEAGEDQRLRARPAFGQSAIDEQLVCTLFGHHIFLVIASGEAARQSSVASAALDCFASLAMTKREIISPRPCR